MNVLTLLLLLTAPAQASSSLASGVSCGNVPITFDGSTYLCTDFSLRYSTSPIPPAVVDLSTVTTALSLKLDLTSTSSATLPGIGVSTIQPVNSLSSTTAYAYFINKSSGAMSPGTIVALSTFTDNAINFSVAAATTQVIGVVSPNTIAQGAAGLVAIGGFVKTLFAAATPRGYQVQISATAGNAQGSAAPAAGSTIGVLTENCAANTKCWVFLR